MCYLRQDVTHKGKGSKRAQNEYVAVLNLSGYCHTHQLGCGILLRILAHSSFTSRASFFHKLRCFRPPTASRYSSSDLITYCSTYCLKVSGLAAISEYVI